MPRTRARSAGPSVVRAASEKRPRRQRLIHLDLAKASERPTAQLSTQLTRRDTPNSAARRPRRWGARDPRRRMLGDPTGDPARARRTTPRWRRTRTASRHAMRPSRVATSLRSSQRDCGGRTTERKAWADGGGDAEGRFLTWGPCFDYDRAPGRDRRSLASLSLGRRVDVAALAGNGGGEIAGG